MKTKTKRIIWTTFGTAMLAATIGVAGAGTASATNDPTTAPRAQGDRAALICSHLDEIAAKRNGRLDLIARRQAWLATKRAEAVAAGNDRIVERIDKISARLTERTANVHDRSDRLDAWAIEHCTPV